MANKIAIGRFAFWLTPIWYTYYELSLPNRPQKKNLTAKVWPMTHDRYILVIGLGCNRSFYLLWPRTGLNLGRKWSITTDIYRYRKYTGHWTWLKSSSKVRKMLGVFKMQIHRLHSILLMPSMHHPLSCRLCQYSGMIPSWFTGIQLQGFQGPILVTFKQINVRIHK